MTQPNFKDITGQKFGKLTVIERVENNIYGAAQWLCKCDCGKNKITLGSYLFRGLITHCGCENRNRSSAFIDMTGKRIGKLIVIERVHNDTSKRAQWLCKCQCGKEIIAKGNDLRNNRVTCCGECEQRMNNFEKIKQMTVDEMAEIADKTYDDCIVRVFGGQETYEKCEVSRIWDSEDSCSKCFKKYLLQEVEE